MCPLEPTGSTTARVHADGAPPPVRGAGIPSRDGALELDSNERSLRRVAYDLHDGPVQALSAALLELKSGRNRPEGEPRELRVPEIESLVQSALSGIREICAYLRPHALDTEKLDEMIGSWLNDDSVVSSDVSTSLVVNGADWDSALTPSARIALFRIVQESVTNALKHANATRIDVDLTLSEREVACSVTDDGLGFDVLDAEVLSRTSHGLVYMQDRAKLLGGTMDVQSGPGAGTKVSVRLPVWQ